MTRLFDWLCVIAIAGASAATEHWAIRTALLASAAIGFVVLFNREDA